MTDQHLFVFGLGYSALAFVRRARGRFASVGGTVRSAEKVEALRAEGIEALLFDGMSPGEGVREALQRTTHLVQSIAPDDAGDPALRLHGGDIAAAGDLGWIGYLSTVGVYGDHQGAWVDEAAETHAVSRRSRNRVEAEGEWIRLGKALEVPVALLRLAGIYGPGRNTFVHLAEGTARRLVKPDQVFNRIHVEDIAAVIDAAAAKRASGVFNVTDNEPAPPQDVVAFAAELAGHPPLPDIPFATAELSPMARSFYGENKRVSNARLQRDLGVELSYPTYREALRALWETGRWRG